MNKFILTLVSILALICEVTEASKSESLTAKGDKAVHHKVVEHRIIKRKVIHQNVPKHQVIRLRHRIIHHKVVHVGGPHYKVTHHNGYRSNIHFIGGILISVATLFATCIIFCICCGSASYQIENKTGAY